MHFVSVGAITDAPFRCEVFDPPFSYWCSAHPSGGGGFQYYVPSGMDVPAALFPVRAWRPIKHYFKGRVASLGVASFAALLLHVLHGAWVRRSK